eukprot:c22014_g1_i1 orf=758-1981(-)
MASASCAAAAAACSSMFSAFVDALVDFSVGGQFLGSPLDPPFSSAQSDTRISSLQPPLLSDGVSPHSGGGFTRLKSVDRLLAIGDIHGDLGKAREALKIAGVIDDLDRWVGGSTVVVQVGDLLDRWGQEMKVIYLFEKLRREARRAGGDVFVMNGNHEIMNVEGDFRYATAEALQEFQNWGRWFALGIRMKNKCEGLEMQQDAFQNIPDAIPESQRARFAALRPGGPISSRFLASHPSVLMVGSTIFVHGGLLPNHAKYGLERINEEVSQWILGNSGFLGPSYVRGRNAMVWLRRYSELSESKCDCDLLNNALEAIPGAKRMVVGHTIQQPLGINGACSNRVIRVDVGMSQGCGDAAPEVLEIYKDRELRVLSRSFDRKINVTDSPLWGEYNPGLGSLLTENGVRQA